MRLRWWCLACAVAMFTLSGMAIADDEHGHGHGKGHGNGHDNGKHHEQGEDRDHGNRHYYSDHDRGEMRAWYREQGDRLPPGLAKRDRLPPGLERQLQVRGTLPPGLQKKMVRVPEEFERRLPPPPPGCAHFFIGGNVVLVNRSSFLVLDIVHF
jgi:Ni/Co efflux regulator RcnB